MAFRIRHSPSLALGGQLAYGVGRGQRREYEAEIARQQANIEEDRALRQQALGLQAAGQDIQREQLEAVNQRAADALAAREALQEDAQQHALRVLDIQDERDAERLAKDASREALKTENTALYSGIKSLAPELQGAALADYAELMHLQRHIQDNPHLAEQLRPQEMMLRRRIHDQVELGANIPPNKIDGLIEASEHGVGVVGLGPNHGLAFWYDSDGQLQNAAVRSNEDTPAEALAQQMAAYRAEHLKWFNARLSIEKTVNAYIDKQADKAGEGGQPLFSKQELEMMRKNRLAMLQAELGREPQPPMMMGARLPEGGINAMLDEPAVPEAEAPPPSPSEEQLAAADLTLDKYQEMLAIAQAEPDGGVAQALREYGLL
jgi:hypothetical protein